MSIFGVCCADAEGTTVEAVGDAPAQPDVEQPNVATQEAPKAAELATAPPPPELVQVSPDGPYSGAEIIVRVEKKSSSDRIGLDISSVGGKVLKVWKVKEGLIQEYNNGKPVEQQVAAGDGIMAVNDKKGFADDLLKEVSTAEVLELVVKRGMFAL
eukprot:TRINITY_DN22794_c0_g1_i1.p2 TRINITY_DN22794_c0_g1~~TRINITY_DN22794_c0_g1_i1.p2  ORF type:complete len:156 (+),score=39.89 TRINITY_DN22794_c0_g1_i1:80-547(+)